MAPDPILDSEVRRADEDRWLASRFASARVRPRLIAVYALVHELARARAVVAQPVLGEMRLTWWREATEAALAGAAAAHPVLQALAAAHAEAPLPFAVVERLIEAHRPGAKRDDDHHDAVAGGVMRLALAAAGALTPALEPLIVGAARAWGRLELVGAGGREQARSAIAEIRGRDVPAAAFPALGYVTLAQLYLERRTPSLLRRQLALVYAAARGKL